MHDEMVRLYLELPLREQVRRSLKRPAPSPDDPRLDEAQADIMERVIREVLGGLDLSPEAHERGLAITAAALRRAAGEDRHDDPIVTADQHRPVTVEDQQS